MSAAAPFVTQLRSRPGVIRLGTGDEPVITLRVQSAETWDTVRVEAPASMPVIEVKRAALEVLVPDEPYHQDFMIKLNGFEVLNEDATLTEAGAKNGSTLLVHLRRRRPVR